MGEVAEIGAGEVFGKTLSKDVLEGIGEELDNQLLKEGLEFTAEDFGSLPKDMQDVVTEQMDDLFKDLKENGELTPEMNAEEAIAKFKERYVGAEGTEPFKRMEDLKSNLKKRIEGAGLTTQGKFMPDDVKVLEKFDGIDLKNYEGYFKKDLPTEVELDPGEIEKISKSDAAKAELQTARDEAYGTKAVQERVKSLEKSLEEAQEAFEKGQMKEFEVDDVRESLELNREAMGTEGKLKNAEEVRADAEEKYGDGSEQYKEADARYNEAKEAHEAAEKAVSEKLDAYMETTRWETRYSYKTKEFVKAKAKNVWGKLKKLPGTLFESLWQAVLFMVPGWIEEGIVTMKQREALRKTMEAPQLFGGVLMQIPQNLINSKAPEVSLPLYVGLEAPSDTDKHVINADTDEYLKRAHYYAVVPEYGEDWGSEFIDGGDHFSGILVHLNTGLKFWSDGEPVSKEHPAVILLGDKDESSKEEFVQPHLDDLSGLVLHGVVKESFVAFQDFKVGKSSYKGSEVISELFDPNDNTNIWNAATQIGYEDAVAHGYEYSSLFNPSMGQFQQGFKFGPYLIKEFKGLEDAVIEKITGDKKALGAHNVPFVGRGEYIYMTQDTPFIKQFNQIYKDDPEAQFHQDYSFYDYIVMLNESGKQVALEVPSGAGNQFGFQTYQLNAKEAEFACSLLQLDDASAQGSASIIVYNNAGDEKRLSVKLDAFVPDEIHPQVSAIRRYIHEEMKYGPFMIGGVKLETEHTWVENEIQLYRVPGFLENGKDDYVVALDLKQQPIMLPNYNVKYFVSLVTSRFYDNTYHPWKNKTLGYDDFNVYIVKDESAEAGYHVYAFPAAYDAENNAQSPLADKKDAIVGKTTAPLYSIFMDPDVNPNPLPSTFVQLFPQEEQATVRWPSPNQWALFHIKGPDGDTMDAYLEEKDDELLNIIDSTYKEWRTYFDSTDAQAREKAMGPFKFTKDLARNVYIRAASMDDIAKAYWVYRPTEYIAALSPREFVVASRSQTIDSTTGDEYDSGSPQKYAISLSRGDVYENNRGEIVGHIDATPLNEFIARNYPDDGSVDSLNKRIRASQKYFDYHEEATKYIPFGKWHLFLDRRDKLNGYYIYADVSDFTPGELADKTGAALGDYIVSEAANKKVDFFVYGKKVSGKGNYAYGYAIDDDANGVIVSLITGAVYSKGGLFVGSYGSYAPDDAGEMRTPMDFYNNILSQVRLRSNEFINEQGLAGLPYPSRPNVLVTLLNELTQKNYELVQKEIKEYEQIREEEEKTLPDLDGTILNDLVDDSRTPYEEEHPNMFNRYLKLYKGKYYKVVPDVGGDDLSKKVSILDYSLSADLHTGLIYDASGKTRQRLTGWELDHIRALDGILVDDQGAETLTIGLDHPSIPLATGDMLKLDATLLKSQLDTAQKAFDDKQDALTKYIKDNKTIDFSTDKTFQSLQDGAQQAGLELGHTRIAYSAALSLDIVKTHITVPTGINPSEFYYNKQIRAFFAHIKTDVKDFYMELTGGYPYNVNGAPHLEQYALYHDKDNDLYVFYQFLEEEPGKPLTAVLLLGHKGDKGSYAFYTQHSDDPYSVKRATMDGVEGFLYFLSSDQDDQNSINAFFNQAGDTLTMYNKLAPGQYQKIGTFNKETTLIYTPLLYMGTRSSKTDEVKATRFYEEDFKDEFTIGNRTFSAQKQVFVVWDNTSDMNLQKILYKKQLINLTMTESNVYTGQLVDPDTQSKKQITVTKEKKSVDGTNMQRSWISIQEDGVTKVLDFMYEFKIFDQVYDWLKKWQINVVIDALSRPQLVSALPTTLASVSITSVVNLPEQQSEVDILQKSLAQVKHDPRTNKYVYKLSKARDTGKDYFGVDMEGIFVDLATGILFDTDNMPYAALSMSERVELLSTIGLTVIVDEHGMPKLSYRSLKQVGT